MTATWTPIFDGPVVLEPVSSAARRRDVRKDDYEAFAAAIHATASEAHDVRDMLELLECTHGATAIKKSLQMVSLALASAVIVLKRSLTALALQWDYANAALFVGALVETEVQIEPSKRRAPNSAVAPRMGSPNLDFEDFLLSARIIAAIEGQVLSRQHALQQTWHLADVICACRQQLGQDKTLALFKTTAPPTTGHETAWLCYVSNVERGFLTLGIETPIAWRLLKAMQHNHTFL